MFLKTVSLSIILSLFLSTASAKETIDLHLIENYPPYSWQENGEIQGIDIAILRELSARSGIKFEISLAPWKRIFTGLKNGMIGAAAQAWWRKERTQYVSYMTIPTRQSTISVMASAASNLQIQSLDDFTGKTIGKLRAFSISTAYEARARAKEFRTVELDSIEQAISMLENGRIELFVHSTIPVDYYLHKTKQKKKFKRLAFINDNVEGTYVILSRRKYQGREKRIILQLDKHLSQMHREGFTEKTIRQFTE